MTYQDMRKRLEELERKIEEHGATEAVLLSIDDGIDTRRLLMKRKTLYELVYPIIQEETEKDTSVVRWPNRSLKDEKALLCAVAWAQCRSDMPDSVNRLLWEYYDAAPSHYPLVSISDGSADRIVSGAEDANALYHLQKCFENWREQIREMEDTEWER